MLSKHKVYTKNNILYIIREMLYEKDTSEIDKAIHEVLKELQKPFSVIVDNTRVIESDTLIHPEDEDLMRESASFVDNAGRDISVWVMPRETLLDWQFKNLCSQHDVFYASNIEEAEEIIRTYREKRQH